MSTGVFILHSQYTPSGDQPEAIARLISGIEEGAHHQTLKGITGSGKTFTMANVIHRLKRPTLILAPNKTLTAQLYDEMKQFFPENAVEYFVSYYDYFQYICRVVIGSSRKIPRSTTIWSACACPRRNRSSSVETPSSSLRCRPSTEWAIPTIIGHCRFRSRRARG